MFWAKSISVEQKALRLSVCLTVFSTLWATVMLILTGSLAIALDVAYSLLSAVLSFLGMLTVSLIGQGATQRHPMGFYIYEVFVSFLRSLVLLGMMLVMFFHALIVLLRGGSDPALNAIMIYTVPSMGAALLGYFYSSRALKVQPSMTLEADTNEWRADLLVSLITFGIIFAVSLVKNTPIGWIGRYADPVVVLVLCGVLSREPFILMKDSFRHLSLQSMTREFSRDFRKDLAAFVEKEGNFQLGQVDVISIGRMVWIMAEVLPKDSRQPLEIFIRFEDEVDKLAKSYFPHMDLSLYFE